MPSPVVYATVDVPVRLPVRLTTTLAAPPASLTVYVPALNATTGAGSLSVIVSRAVCGAPSVPELGLDSRSASTSASSWTRSCPIVTLNVWLRMPLLNVSVPEAAV